MQDAGQQSSEDFLKETLGKANPFSGTELRNAIANMTEYGRQLNNVFGQSKQRISELMQTVADAEPRIIRLGGNISATFETMRAVAETLQRNVTVTEDVLSQLYATSKVLGEDADTLVKSFADAGYQAARIGPEASEAVIQVQNLGLNTKQIMGTVLDNMSELNKFNFSNGIQGLTKMAAQAAMVRFNMADALEFANKVQDPEGAIQMAAGLQRLGVAAGALADPFALMNASINDPGALQESLINMTKQFSYFDEKTKSFKISPQGILTMKELSKETGISYDNLAKTSLGAAELDKRLSQISPQIKFGSEEDKQYLANLGAMNEKGEYTIKLDSGIEKKLTDLTQTEFDDLIKQQKEAPKTVEDIARAQLKSSDAARASLESISKAYYNGIASVRIVRENLAELGKAATITSGAVSGGLARTDLFRTGLEDITTKLGTTADAIINKGANPVEAIKQLGLELKESMKGAGGTLYGIAARALDKIAKDKEQLKDASFVGKNFGSLTEKLQEFVRANTPVTATASRISATQPQTPTTYQVSPQSILFSEQQRQLQSVTIPQNSVNITEEKKTIDYTGTVRFVVDAPPGVSKQQLETYLNTEEFKETIYKYVQQKDLELGKKR
jgi:hypothetical protein